MEDNNSDYITAQIQKVSAFRIALSSESDRGCALFAAAYLDSSLSDLLFVSLVENKRIEEDLFDGTAPLSSFSSRIKLAYYLGLISKACRRDLDIIRKIRNDFAHDPEIISFQSQSIHDRSKSLSFSYHPNNVDPRSHFTAAAIGILAYLHTTALTTNPHVERPDDPPPEELKAEHQALIRKLLSELIVDIGETEEE